MAPACLRAGRVWTFQKWFTFVHLITHPSFCPNSTISRYNLSIIEGYNGDGGMEVCDMNIKRIDHIGIIVNNLAAANG